MRRGVRVRDLLEKIDADRDWPYWKLSNAGLRKAELVKLARRLELDFDETHTVPRIRTAIREEVGLRTHKSGMTRFSTSELLQLMRAIDHTKYLDAEDTDLDWDDVQRGDRLLVNGDRLKVTETYSGPHDGTEAADQMPLDRYWEFRFGSRRRLMVLWGLDKDECKYRHSVVLEEAVDYGPYKRWTKEAYVESLDVAPTVLQ